MKKCKSKSLKIFFVIIISLILILGNGYIFTIFNFFSFKNEKAIATNNTRENISISNGNFTQSSTSSYPKNPSNWTKCNLDETDIVSGIIDLTTSAFNSYRTSNYKLPSEIISLTSVQNSGDNSVLMINNISNTSKHFYYTSTNINLEANSYYIISIWGKTYNSTLNINLSNSNKTINLNHNRGNTNWEKFDFYVATSTIESTSVSLTVSLGTNEVPQKGCVFFDYSSCKKISENEFQETSEPKKVSLIENNFITDRITNQNFENGNSGWTLNNLSSAKSAIYEILPNETHNNLINNTHILKLATNDIDEYLFYESDVFVLKQQEILKVSFFAKTNCTATASVNVESFKLNGENITESLTKPESKSLTLSTTNAGTSTNGWTCYTFVLTGHTWCDAELKLKFELGSQSTKTQGEVLIDDITTQQLTYLQKSKCETQSNINSLSMQSFTTPSIPNGYFNLASEITYNGSNNVSFPIEPENWSIVSENDYTESDFIMGIVNTNPTAFTNSGISSFMNPGKTPAQFNSDYNLNNVLVVKNKHLPNFGVKSASFNLTELSYYKIQLYILSQGGAIGKIQVGTDDLIIAEKDDITNSSWQKITFYVKTSSFSISPSIKIIQTNNNGALFVDDVVLSTIEETNYSDAILNLNSNNLIFDLSSESFEISSNQYTGTLIDSNSINIDELLNTGIYDASSGIIPDLNNAGSADGDNKFLMIYSPDDVYYEFKSANEFTASANAYYKLSIYCKVKNIIGLNSNAENVGANIYLTNFDNKFTGIKTTNNEWQCFSFFINPTSTTTFNIVLSLGSTDALTSGFALFDKISFETLDENSFDTEYNLAKTKNDNALKLQPIIEEESNGAATTETPPVKTNFDWLWIPSLILAVALIIAVVSVSVKNIKIKPKKKKVKSEYDKEQLKIKENKKMKKQKFIDFISVEDENENKKK